MTGEERYRMAFKREPRKNAPHIANSAAQIIDILNYNRLPVARHGTHKIFRSHSLFLLFFLFFRLKGHLINF